MANALDRWDEEGGAPATLWPLPYEIGDLLDVERRVLECLGAALVSEWNGLPTEVQRRLFERAASGASGDAARLKSQIARFLHGHKDASESRCWASRSFGGVLGNFNRTGSAGAVSGGSPRVILGSTRASGSR